jgi:hypothetical protein
MGGTHYEIPLPLMPVLLVERLIPPGPLAFDLCILRRTDRSSGFRCLRRYLLLFVALGPVLVRSSFSSHYVYKTRSTY